MSDHNVKTNTEVKLRPVVKTQLCAPKPLSWTSFGMTTATTPPHPDYYTTNTDNVHAFQALGFNLAQ